MRKIFLMVVAFVLVMSGTSWAVLDLTGGNTLVITGNTNTTNLSVGATSYFGGASTFNAAIDAGTNGFTAGTSTSTALSATRLYGASGTLTMPVDKFTVSAGTVTVTKGSVIIGASHGGGLVSSESFVIWVGTQAWKALFTDQSGGVAMTFQRITP